MSRKGVSFAWAAFAAMVACSAAGGMAAGAAASAAEAEAHLADILGTAASAAEKAKSEVIFADPEDRATYLDAFAAAGIHFELRSDSDPPGVEARGRLGAVHEQGFVARITETPHELIVHAGTPAGQGLWLWASSPVDKPPSAARAAVRGLASGLVASILGALLAAGAGAILSRNVRALRVAADRAEAGLPPPPPTPTEPAEFSELREALARMGERVSSERREREIALAGISHDARGPLAAARAAAEAGTDPETERAVVAACSRIEALLGDFVEYARSSDPKKETFDAVGALVSGIRDGFPSASIKAPDDPFWARGDSALLRRAALNLAANCKKHGPGDCSAEITVDRGWLRLRLRDSGTSASASAMRELRAPFRRGDPARSKPGSGLGLAIADRGAAASMGRLLFEDADGGGFYSVIEIPEAPDDAE